MIEQNAEKFLKKLTSEHLFNNPNAILNIDGVIIAFGKYTIEKKNGVFVVTRGNLHIGDFNSSKVAINWCVADKFHQTILAQELLNLDKELERREIEVEHYRSFLNKSTDSNKRFIIFDRLNESQSRIRAIKDQLNKCINSAKYWQQKGFDNETARTGTKKQISAR